ncbi:MAG: putative Ig domain-containing protein [Deltaproteobacteria bacterium]|nr:putative Ig domain-containing protein [Deltaproteobacteria bacterium]
MLARSGAVLLAALSLLVFAGCPDSGGAAGRKDTQGLPDARDPDAPAGGDAVEGDNGQQDPGQVGPERTDPGEPRPDLPIPDGAICAPGATQCVGTNFLKCKADGSDWEVTKCEAGQACTRDGCGTAKCHAGIPECDAQGNVVVCLPDGSGLGAPAPCPKDTICKAGQCIPKACVPGAVQCTTTALLTCAGDPPAWVETPCGEGMVCFKGECIECFADEQCKDGTSCENGKCVRPALAVVTKELPDGQVGAAYAAQVEAKGGDGQYTWSSTGGLPDGLALGADGKVAGTPTIAGDFSVEVKVTDGLGLEAAGNVAITVHGTASEVTITSKSPLPNAEEGTGYSFAFKAIGGVTPYTWGIAGGKVPVGLTFASDGTLFGTPAEHGAFDFTVRVFDSGDPTAKASAPFKLTVAVAPLEIVGDQVINLFLTKAVVLPLITVVEGIPIPYSTRLQAKGGVKPYHWVETEMPGLVTGFIPQAGVPEGLKLADDGTLSGAVTKTSSVVELKIPFVNYTLTGFFFMAEVTDSQSPADSDSAIFLIPTVPVNLGGGGLPF